MGKQTRTESLVELRLTGQDSFYADDNWRKGIIGSITCPRCLNAFEQVRSVDAVVRNRVRRTDIDIISPDCGFVQALSLKLIEVVGPRLISRVAGLGWIMDVNGFEHNTHRTAVTRHESVIVRGEQVGVAGLCRECGRLLYLAGGESYVLKADIPSEPFFLSDGRAFCTERFWRDRIYPVPLTRVEALEYPILAKAKDGLPASRKALKRYLKSHRMFR